MAETSVAAGAVKPAGRRGNQTKFIVGGAIIVAVVAYLIASSLGGSQTYYMTVGELKGKGAAAVGQKVRVAGIVSGDSIQVDDRNLNLRFEMADESGQLTVAYHGIRPDMLRDQAEAVVEGKLNGQGVFDANSLLLKCPSKYEAAATTQASSGATN